MKLKKNRRCSVAKNQVCLGCDVTKWGAMEGLTFNGDYLGYSTLSKPATGVGVLQQPIKDLYLKFRKTGSTGTAKKVILRILQGGMAISLVDAGGVQKGDMFYDLNSINYIEAVRFTVLRGSEKKPRAMFVPLDETKAPPSKDKNSFTVDKSYHFLTQVSHPPLLACVLRRPKGVKALDCHIFVLESSEDAHKIVSIINQIQAGGFPNMEYVGGEIRQNENSFNRGQRSDVIRTEFGEYSVYRGTKQFELNDDFFRPGQEGGPRGPPPGDPPGDDGWRYERQQSMEENWRNYDDQYVGVDDRYQIRGSYDSGPVRVGSNYESSQPRHDFQYDRNDYIAHSRQRSSDSGEGRMMNRSFSDTSDRGSRYDDGMERGRTFPDNRGSRSPRNSDIIPPRVADKPSKQDHPITAARSTHPGPPAPRSTSPRALEPQRTHQYPQSPTYSQPSRNFQPPPTTPEYSMSNLESRAKSQDIPDEEPQTKPVAKVPPHLVAGVKVLPTDFRAIKLKHKPPKQSSEESEHDYDNVIQKFGKPVLKDQDHYGGFQSSAPSDRYNEERNSYNYNNSSSGDDHKTRIYNYSSDYGRYNPDEERHYIEQYDDPNFRVQRRVQDQRSQDSRGSQNRYSVPAAVYDGKAHDSGNRWSGSSGGSRSQSTNEMGSRVPLSSGYDNSGARNNQKDAEIAYMFTNFHVQHRDEQIPFSTGGTNFEQSLGYFP